MTDYRVWWIQEVLRWMDEHRKETGRGRSKIFNTQQQANPIARILKIEESIDLEVAHSHVQVRTEMKF